MLMYFSERNWKGVSGCDIVHAMHTRSFPFRPRWWLLYWMHCTLREPEKCTIYAVSAAGTTPGTTAATTALTHYDCYDSYYQSYFCFYCLQQLTIQNTLRRICWYLLLYYITINSANINQPRVQYLIEFAK